MTDDLLRAALLGVFDPKSLIDTDAPDGQDRLKALATQSIEQDMNGRWYWTLKPEARLAGLSRLAPAGKARQAQISGLPTLLPKDDLGKALASLLADKPDKNTAQFIARAQKGGRWTFKDSAQDPNVLGQALKLLLEAGVTLADWAADPKTARALSRAVVLDRRAHAAHILLPTPFRGRGREMRVLENYIRNGRAVDKAANPVLESLDPEPANKAITAIAVTGLGGSGKSALVEALSRKIEKDGKVSFLEFDLDQTSLRSGERVALTMELTRQIGLLHPTLDQPLSAIRRQLRTRLSHITGSSGALETSSTAVISAIGELGDALKSAKLQSHGFALVFDTFEQALVAGEDRVRLIADWLTLLRDMAGMKKLRVILSGREADLVAKFDTPNLNVVGRIELGDLGTNAGRAKLRDMFRRFGIKHLKYVPDLIATYGSNPLVIEIIANFCRDRNATDIRKLAKGNNDLKGKLTADQVQRFLYTRTLERIKDEDLRPLASPGLILRRINSEVIEGILAEACGFETPLPAGKAEDLYDRLSKQVWLVREALDGMGLEHIPDLRRVMLPQILSLSEAGPVLNAAVTWFRLRSDEAGHEDDELEALYYAVLREPDYFDYVDRDQLLRLSDYLGMSAADLQPKAQAQLREATGAILKKEEIRLLSGDSRTRAATKRSSLQVSEGLERSVGEEALLDDETAEGGGWVQSLFANGEFGELRARSKSIFVSFFPDAFNELAQPNFLDVEHPAWLSSICVLTGSPQGSQKLTDTIEQWWKDPGNTKSLEELIARAATGRFWDVDAILHTIIAMFHKPIWTEFVHRMSEFETFGHSMSGMISDPPEWRRSSLQAAFIPDGKPFDPTVPVEWSAVPFLHRDGALWLLEQTGYHDEGATPQRKDDHAELEQIINGGAVPLKQLQEVMLRPRLHNFDVDPSELSDAAFDALIPGMLPEFRAPIRLILEEVGADPRVERALLDVTQHLPWWPSELAPRLLSKGLFGPTLIGALIDILDHASMLPLFARSLSERLSDHKKTQDIADLIDAFCLQARKAARR